MNYTTGKIKEKYTISTNYWPFYISLPRTPKNSGQGCQSSADQLHSTAPAFSKNSAQNGQIDPNLEDIIKTNSTQLKRAKQQNSQNNNSGSQNNKNFSKIPKIDILQQNSVELFKDRMMAEHNGSAGSQSSVLEVDKILGLLKTPKTSVDSGNNGRESHDNENGENLDSEVDELSHFRDGRNSNSDVKISEISGAFSTKSVTGAQNLSFLEPKAENTPTITGDFADLLKLLGANHASQQQNLDQPLHIKAENMQNTPSLPSASGLQLASGLYFSKNDRDSRKDKNFLHNFH